MFTLFSKNSSITPSIFNAGVQLEYLSFLSFEEDDYKLLHTILQKQQDDFFNEVFIDILRVAFIEASIVDVMDYTKSPKFLVHLLQELSNNSDQNKSEFLLKLDAHITIRCFLEYCNNDGIGKLRDKFFNGNQPQKKCKDFTANKKSFFCASEYDSKLMIDGKLPIIWAIEHGSLLAVQKLLEYDKDLAVVSSTGAIKKSPISLATELGHVDIVEELSKHKDINLEKASDSSSKLPSPTF